LVALRDSDPPEHQRGRDLARQRISVWKREVGARIPRGRADEHGRGSGARRKLAAPLRKRLPRVATYRSINDLVDGEGSERAIRVLVRVVSRQEGKRARLQAAPGLVLNVVDDQPIGIECRDTLALTGGDVLELFRSRRTLGGRDAVQANAPRTRANFVEKGRHDPRTLNESSPIANSH